jgi:DNA-binding LacI/PurR family transcriptional regulator
MSAKSDSRGGGLATPPRKVSLKFLADRLGLSTATISLVMNRSPAAKSIPKETQARIFAAAREHNYRPNFLARSLRAQRTFSIGVMVPEVSEGYAAGVLSGIEEYLLEVGYFYLVVGHHHKADLVDEYPRLLLGRSVDALIAVDMPWPHGALQVPAVRISGVPTEGIDSVILNHARAADLALQHLCDLGHKRIAFIKGQDFSSDTQARWEAIQSSAQRTGVAFRSALTAQLSGDLGPPTLGYEVTKKLLNRRETFTAIFAFNDLAAIGAIRAIREKGFDVPRNVSVVGFDDIPNAEFQWPGLTTIRQPLRKMGRIAAETVLRKIGHTDHIENSQIIVVEPELIIRGSTAPAPMI